MTMFCASCGKDEDEETTFVVTTLDYSDIKNTRTEICVPCWVAENLTGHLLHFEGPDGSCTDECVAIHPEHAETRSDTPIDTKSSASRQHYIDTGRYLNEGEVL